MKKIIILFMCLSSLLSISLFGCSSNNLPENFYEDSTIFTGQSNGYSMKKSVQSVKNNVYNGKFTFNGFGTLWNYETDQDKTISASYSLKVSNGKGKLVLINGDNDVSILSELSSNLVPEKKDIKLKLKKGTNIIKFVGQDAETEMTLTVEEGKLNLMGN